MVRRNAHASCVVLGSKGVVIRGRSGAGKTTLALALIEACRGRGQFARLVADDQIWLEVRNGRVVAVAPDAIAGLVEIIGVGPSAVAFEAGSVVDLIVDLVETAEAARYQDEAACSFEGVRIRHLNVPERQVVCAVRAVLSRLDIFPLG